MSAETTLLTDAQLRAEIAKCEHCAQKPCRVACPADCSPADFIMAAKMGERSDYRRAAALIYAKNPLGGVCGAVCPDWHCMSACSRRGLDGAVNIPAVQATLLHKAKELGQLPEFKTPVPNGYAVAIIGAGPAGLAAAAMLAQNGYKVDVQEQHKQVGGSCLLIPKARLTRSVLAADLAFIESLGDITIKTGKTVKDPRALLDKGYVAVLVAAGLGEPAPLGVRGEDVAIAAHDLLAAPKGYKLKGKRVAIVGVGAVAVDCAWTAVALGAKHVELLGRRVLGEMNLTAKERATLLEVGAHISGRVRVTEVVKKAGKLAALKLRNVELPAGKRYDPRLLKDVKGSDHVRKDFDAVVFAIGARPAFALEHSEGVFYAGDIENGATTVVEAVAAGKNAAEQLDTFVTGAEASPEKKKTKSHALLRGRVVLPVPLCTDFFGTEISSPFLLSAAPPTDGYLQMKKAYEAGWAGGVMKTAFDNLPIHIPSEYMFAYTASTYANCDNVSGHPLDRVCREIEQLRCEYPDRLTMGSTGGPVTGNDESDRRGWQANTRKLDAAGAMGVEYSLSCPQGGDGTKGDIVSQDPELTAKIIDWVLQVSDADVPKLFKLTAAVTSIHPIVAAIKEVFARYPHKKAGVTLANSFPSLAMRKGDKSTWEEGVVAGMSGEGVSPISNLTLANVARHGITVSGNGGPMDYKAAAHFLALGAKSVQFCTVVMKHGYGIVDELHSGLSFLMQERGINSVPELIGRAQPHAIRGFVELSPKKKLSQVDAKLCLHCGNCTRCPYFAITLDKKGVPVTDAAHCIGCSICVQKCFAGALRMRERTPAEIAVQQEA